MRKISIFVTAAVVFSLLAMAFVSQPRSAMAAQEVHRVGMVIAYMPDQSITLVDKDGNQFTFELAPDLKLVPAHRNDLLVVGAYVTIIAPNSKTEGKTFATGIVIHPKPPASFPIPKELVKETPSLVESPTEKPLLTETPTGSETATPTGTLITETPTPTGTQTVKSVPENSNSTPPVVTAFLEWLASIFRQLSSAGG
jgi:hypothetical protein